MVQTNATAGQAGPLPPPAGESLQVSAAWPVRSGAVPPLADRFSSRPETGPDLAAALRRSRVVALTPPARRTSAAPHDLLCSTGKTQLAVQYAQAQWQARAIDLLVWVDASSAASIVSGYVAAARTLTGSELPGPADPVAASFLRWLRQTDRRWLVVLDDVPAAEILEGLWPRGEAGQLLITTTNTATTVQLRDVLTLEVGPFSPREAMSYLVGRLSADPDQRRGAIDLIEDLGCQPMALAQATATIAGSWMTCVDYREQYYQRMSELTLPGTPPPPAAGVTWTLSVDHADERVPGGSAQACLALIALLDGHGIPGTVIETAAALDYVVGTSGRPAAEQALAALRVLERADLVSVDQVTAPPLIRMNPSLQGEVQAAMSPDMVAEAGRAAAAALLQAWPAADRDSWQGQSLRSAVACLRRATGGLLMTDGCHPVLLRAGQSLDEAGLTGAAVEYWTDLAALADQVFGPGQAESMSIAERLASAYVTAGRVDDAVAWYQRVMGDWAGQFGPDHPRTLAARVRLGRALLTTGLHEDAIAILRGALQDAERAYGSTHPESASIRDELAAGYLSAGKMPAAVRLYRDILAGHERASGALHPDTLATRQLLAEAYLADGHAKDAFSQYKRALADRQRSQGADHPDTLRVAAALAAAYRQAGRMALAVQLYEQVHAGLARTLGPDDPDALAAGLSLGRVYYAVGRLTDATRLLQDTVTRAERVLAPGDQILTSARESLGAIVGELPLAKAVQFPVIVTSIMAMR